LSAPPSSRIRDRHLVVLAATLAAGTLACGDTSLPSAPGVRPTTAITATAAFQVNDTADVVDAAPGNGICQTAAGTCTLRAAIQESNALAGENTINLPAGTYPLSILPHPGKDDASGSLAITGPLRIFGAGTDTTIVDGIAFRNQGLTQVNLKVKATAGSVMLSGLTLLNGGDYTSGLCGGSNLGVEGGATVLLRKVAVRRGRDYCGSGGIRNSGNLTLDQSVVANNGTQGGAGGGIGNEGTLTIGRSTISANLAESVGGIFNDDEGQLIMRNSTLSANRAEFYASGLYNSGSAILNNVTISKNGETDLDIPAVRTFGSGVTEISNTIIGGNVGPNCAGTLTSAGYNLLGGTAGCTLVGDGTGNIIGVAPKLGPLQDNGGPTPTHALLGGSPALNAGNPATPGSSATACLPGDQRLLPRSATRCDIGAVEMQ
jgi:CSLREA domain-containing protein